MSGGRAVAFTRLPLDQGAFDGTRYTAAGELTLADVDAGIWTSPWIHPGFEVADIVPSWNARTPGGTAVDVALQGTTQAGAETRWYELAHWATSDERTSLPGQEDELGRVETDILRAAAPFRAYRLRLTLHGGEAPPTVSLAAAVASSAEGSPAATSTPLGERLECDVPGFSQAIHDGSHLKYGGGGAVWCSPTSTAMVLAYWGAGPGPDDYDASAATGPDPSVPYAARHTYDRAYRGCGNWPFNTAYAAGFGLVAYVTRLRSLAEAELLLAVGVPLVASIAAGPGELDGYPGREGTAGHLVVLTGIAAAGDPVVNDPAAASNAEVRRVYDRAQFERAWLGGSGGIVYVIHPPELELPPTTGSW